MFQQNGSQPSLSDCLLTGPKFNLKILDILLRFRSHLIAVIADIKKAFLMVGVAEKDRDGLHFLWVKDIHENMITIHPIHFTRVVLVPVVALISSTPPSDITYSSIRVLIQELLRTLLNHSMWIMWCW